MVAGRIGMRGALLLLGVVPVFVAALSIASVARLTHLDARASLDHADAVREFDLVTQVAIDLDSELALLDGWSGSDVVRSGRIGDIVEVWARAQFVSVDEAWAAFAEHDEVARPDLVDGLVRVRAESLAIRDDFGAARPEGVAAAVPGTRSLLGAIRTELQSDALAREGGEWAALVELVDARSILATEAVTVTDALVSGADGDVATTLPLVFDRTDRALSRVERALSGSAEASFRALRDSEAAMRWEDLRATALDRSRDGAPMNPDEILLEVQRGAAFVRGVSTLSADVFDASASGAQADGEAAFGRRDLVVGIGIVLLLVAAAVALVVGRGLAGRVRRASDVAEQISAGELPREPLDLPGHDEVARLASAMDDMVATLRLANDQIGALAAGRTDDPSLESELPGSIGRALRLAIRRLGRTTAELKRRATHDDLTGLLDRRGLDLVIEAWDVERDGCVGVVLLDLDGFKAVNDEFGHHAGDDVLIEVAGRLASTARRSDAVGRLGGDEFVVLLAPDVEASVVEAVSNRIVELVCGPIDLDDGRVNVGASVGWALVPPDTPTSVGVRRADAAMYEAKRAGKGRAISAEPV